MSKPQGGLRKVGLMALLVPTAVHAQAVTVEVRHTTHPHGLTKPEARQVVAAAVQQIRDELGVTLRVVRWSTRRGKPYQARAHHDAYFAGLDVDPSPRAAIVLRVEPKYKHAGQLWSAGIAYTCGWGATVMTGRFDRYPGHELAHSKVAIAHELAHALGADHSDGQDVMNGGAQGLLEAAGWYLGFTERSRREVGECRRQ
jgi:hypothetical protein